MQEKGKKIHSSQANSEANKNADSQKYLLVYGYYPGIFGAVPLPQQPQKTQKDETYKLISPCTII